MHNLHMLGPGVLAYVGILSRFQQITLRSQPTLNTVLSGKIASCSKQIANNDVPLSEMMLLIDAKL